MQVGTNETIAVAVLVAVAAVLAIAVFLVAVEYSGLSLLRSLFLRPLHFAFHHLRGIAGHQAARLHEADRPVFPLTKQSLSFPPERGNRATRLTESLMDYPESGRMGIGTKS